MIIPVIIIIIIIMKHKCDTILAKVSVFKIAFNQTL